MTESELLFTDILNCDRISLYLNKEMPLDKNSSFFISSVLKRRIKGEPIQYILGKTEFMGLEFKVTKDVLIPRHETEILVETAINIVRSQQSTVNSLQSTVNILDLGTGSGCIAVSLAKFLPKAEVFACDISKAALDIAQINARLNELENRIKFVQNNLFSSMDYGLLTMDLIVSNPPYIPTAEIETLQPDIQYEPHMALDGGEDGLDFYRRIINSAPVYLKKDGFIIMEMGLGQKEAIENIFRDSGNFQIKDIVKDYNNIDRIIVARLF